MGENIWKHMFDNNMYEEPKWLNNKKTNILIKKLGKYIHRLSQHTYLQKVIYIFAYIYILQKVNAKIFNISNHHGNAH